jgi:hypothetical protein
MEELCAHVTSEDVRLEFFDISKYIKYAFQNSVAYTPKSQNITPIKKSHLA